MSFTRRQLLVSSAASLLLKPFVDCIEARADGPVVKPLFFTMWKGQCQYGGADKPDVYDVNARNWVPTVSGGEVKLAPLLAPFEKVKAYMTFAIGLDIATSPGDFHHSVQTLFTGTNNSNNGEAGHHAASKYESLEHYVSRRRGDKTEPLVINPYLPYLDVNDAASFPSWGKDATGKLFKKLPTSDPLRLFNDLFGGGGTMAADPTKQAALERARRSMLDAIRADAARIKAAAAPEHRAQIDATLEGFRALEESLVGKNGKPTEGATMACMAPANVASAGKEIFNSEAALTASWNALIDVGLAAIRCGLRSTASFQFLDLLCQSFVPGKIRSGWRHKLHGVTPYHFEHSHFPTGQTYIECEQYIHSFYARFLEGLAAIPANGTNLLQQSLGVYATTMSHNHRNGAASYFVVGNAGGRLKSGRVLQYGNPYNGARSGKPHSDLLVSCLQAFGYDDVTSYGDPALCKGGLSGFLT